MSSNGDGDDRLRAVEAGLDPPDRWRAALAAMARGDEVQAGRLAETAPVELHHIHGLRFFARWDSGRVLALAVIGEVEHRIARRDLADQAAEALAWLGDEDRGHPEFERAFRDRAALEHALAAAAWQAFARACRVELEVDPLILIGAVCGRELVQRAEEELERLSLAEADDAELEAWQARLVGEWRRLVRA